MLLGCAMVLKQIEEELNVRVRFMFQPAEEILEGCKDMIENNILDDVMCAIMIHVSSGTNLKSGSIIIPNAGVAAVSVLFIVGFVLFCKAAVMNRDVVALSEVGKR